MTHEADTTNFSMSLADDAAEAAFSASVNKVPRYQFRDNTAKSEREQRISYGQWSIRDKLEWQCHTCTYLNQPLYLSCEMCGQPRPLTEMEGPVIPSAGNHVNASSTSSRTEVLSAEAQREIMLQQEERMLKQERIKEIMALQQGIFNKIKEENEEAEELEEQQQQLEGSFAWMDLEDTLPIKELPPSRVSVGVTTSKGGKAGGSGKKPMDDISSNTATTAAMSSFSGSSRFNLDWSSNSHNSPPHHQHHRPQSRLSSGRNAAIPDQALASLKEEGTFLGGRTSMLDNSGQSHSSGGYVDFTALKAAVEGNSARDLQFDSSSHHSIPSSTGTGGGLAGESNHSGGSSYGLIGESNHSYGSAADVLNTPDRTRRRGALADSLRSFQEFDGGRQHTSTEDSAVKKQKPSLVGAMAVTGAPTQKSIKQDEDGDKKLPASPVGALAVPGGTPLLSSSKIKSQKEDALREDNDGPKPEAPTEDASSIPKTLFPSMTEEEVPFSRSLYSDRKQELKKKSRSVSPRSGRSRKAEKTNSGKGMGIPLLNRMLRKKSTPKPSVDTN